MDVLRNNLQGIRYLWHIIHLALFMHLQKLMCCGYGSADSEPEQFSFWWGPDLFLDDPVFAGESPRFYLEGLAITGGGHAFVGAFACCFSPTTATR